MPVVDNVPKNLDQHKIGPSKNHEKNLMKKTSQLRHLIIVLGDQLDENAAAFDGFDAALDAVWMAEVAEESTHVWSAKQRTAVFLSAMRHFAEHLRTRSWTVHYKQLDDAKNNGTLAAQLTADIAAHKPTALVMTAPGDWRVLQAMRTTAEAAGKNLDIRDDRHFFSTVREFAAHAKGRKQLRLEYWYRELRIAHNVLMDGDKPTGGQWNFDEDNRESFGKSGPQNLPPRVMFEPDAITRQVIALVNTRFADHPGTLDTFGWPVTRVEALASLAAFIAERLPLFGKYEDAMWQGEAWLYHSHLSSSLNLKLITAREVVQAAETAYAAGAAPLAAVEGFIRQILGWREYVRGIYWTHMPDYVGRNALNAQAALPAFYWTGQTDMACMRDAITQTLEHGYSHHIQRLMVTGLFALLYGVNPQEVHAWYLAVYVDAVEWVELPNVLGMSQFADDGIMASKPYAATGKYIDRMSNYCKGCGYNPANRLGDDACPFTTLYWDFLGQHEARLSKNPRMALQVKNLIRLSVDERHNIAKRAADIRGGLVG